MKTIYGRFHEDTNSHEWEMNKCDECGFWFHDYESEITEIHGKCYCEECRNEIPSITCDICGYDYDDHEEIIEKNGQNVCYRCESKYFDSGINIAIGKLLSEVEQKNLAIKKLEKYYESI